MTPRIRALLAVVIVALVGLVGWLAIPRQVPQLPPASCAVPECLGVRALSGTWNATTGAQVYSLPAGSMSAQEPFNLTYAGRGSSASDCVYVYVGLNDSVYTGAGGPWRVELTNPVSLCPGQSLTVQASFHIDDLANPGGTIVGNRALFVLAPSYSANASNGVPSQVVWAGLASLPIAFQASA